MGSRVNLIFILVFFLLICGDVILSQDIPVYEMIGKKISTVVNTYGKPDHRDNSSPPIECLFYQSKYLRMVFVGDKDGIFQAESCRSLNSESSAKSHLRDIISGCIEKSIKVDTLNTEDFKISTTQMRAEVTLFKNSYSNKYEVRIKAGK